jgi:hypothetical protein
VSEEDTAYTDDFIQFLDNLPVTLCDFVFVEVVLASLVVLSVLLILNEFVDEVPCDIPLLVALELDIPLYTINCDESGP